MTIPFHPVANIFPLLEGEELDALAADIKEHGLREPIILCEGMILDGRNRYRACLKAGVEPTTRNYCGDPSDKALVAYVVSFNLKRRHLDESQRGMVADKLANMRRGDNQHSDEDRSIDLTSQEQAAEMMNVSVPTVKRAHKVRTKGIPELGAAVEKGEVSVSAAAAVADLPQEEQKAVVEAGPQAVKDKAKAQKEVKKGLASQRDDTQQAITALQNVSKWIGIVAKAKCGPEHYQTIIAAIDQCAVQLQSLREQFTV